MTPTALRSTRLAMAFLFALATAVTLAPRGSAAQTSEPATLRDYPNLRAERIAMLREEFKERQREIREMRERLREAKKKARGRKVEEAKPDADQNPRAAATRTTSPFGIDRALVAPTNVKANDKTADGLTAGQAEQAIAMLGQNGLCAWNDGQGFNTPPDVQGYGYTTNGGASWTDGGVPLKQGTITAWSSDPSVTVNEKTGDFYYCGLTNNSGTNNNGVGVARAHFSGASFIWDAATMVAAGPSSTQGFDKQWICADSLNGNLYVTWTLFTTTGGHIWFSRSTNNGATWSAPLQLSRSWENGLVSGSRPAVGPNGEVYVIYSAIGPVDADSMKIVKSTDGGVTFGPSYVAGLVMDNYFTGAPGFNRGRAVTFPAIAVDRSTGPNRGRVYATWHNSVNFYGDAFGSTANANSKSEVENNGNFTNATSFTVGNTLRGTLSSTSDVDNFKFSATQGTTYVFFADSVRTTSLKYTMRLYCPNDTTVLSRLALSSDGASSSSVNVHALIVWTCPTTGTYYFRMQGSSSTGGYRVRTTTHTPVASDLGRDARDITVTSSATGTTGWSALSRPNDDLARYDNWLPEIAVPCDGIPYVMWFDWRDAAATCYAGSNIHLARSTNAGATWSANQAVTTAPTPNWSQVISNIAPNQGDYSHMYGGDCIAMAFADGRLGDADVFTARLTTESSLASCPASQTVVAGTTFNGSATVANANSMFANDYNYTITLSKAWPGFPANGTTSAPSSSSGNIAINIPVPDTAAHNEVQHVCVTISQNGACAHQCCFDITVYNPATATLASLVNSSAEPGRVSLRWLVGSEAAVRVERSEDGTAWSSLGERLPASGFVAFEDSDVRPGTRYAYRLAIPSGGRDVYAGQTWVEVPAAAEFALHGAFPNPAKDGFAVSFSLPRQDAATLELIDLGGRRVLTRDVGGLGPGRHTLSLRAESAGLPLGVYALRLTQGKTVATSKVSLIR